ncbi:hypothetical protein LPJ61_007018, partial [Coemansia biformis]
APAEEWITQPCPQQPGLEAIDHAAESDGDVGMPVLAPGGQAADEIADGGGSKNAGLVVDDIFDMEGASSDLCGPPAMRTPLSLPVNGIAALRPSSVSPLTRAVVAVAAQAMARVPLQETITPRRLNATSSDEYLSDNEAGRLQKTSPKKIVGI